VILPSLTRDIPQNGAADLVTVPELGRFPGLADPTNPDSISRHARNPRIARVCADLGITQELGEGIRRKFSEMQRVGLAEPMCIQTTVGRGNPKCPSGILASDLAL